MTFNGFEAANTTPVPDILFDTLLPDLSGAELKVMLYIIRRTSGFKKTTDAISLTQFEEGITTKDGRVLDRGCGLSRETICNALQSLEKRGCIKSDKRSHNGGKEITAYSINFAYDEKVVGFSDYLVQQSDHALVGKSDHPSRKIREKVVGKSDIQETVQETVKQETEEREEVANATAPAASSSFHFPQNDEERKQYDDFMCIAHEAVAKANKGTRHSKTIKVTVPKRPKQQPITMPISPEAQRILDDWQGIFKRAIVIHQTDIDAAERFVKANPTQEELRLIRAWLFETDNPQKPWYKKIGVGLPDVEKNFGKWQSVQEAPPQTSGSNGHSPNGKMDYNAAIMDTSQNFIKGTEEELAEVERQLAERKAKMGAKR